MTEKQVDILIVGGGLIGATLKLALRSVGYSCLLVDSKPFTNETSSVFDARSLALAPASIRILSMLGLWDLVKQYATPIQLIHVSDQYRFGLTRLHAEPNNPLGFVVEMQYINSALHEILDKQYILAPATLTGLDTTSNTAVVRTATGECAIKAQLIVAADGAESTARSLCNLSAQVKNYNQQAIVTNIGLTKPHQNQAFERFTQGGPLALLPMQDNKMSLVWALPPEKAKELLLMDDKCFLHALQKAFGYRLGRLAKVGQRFSYPLQQILMSRQVKWPVVFVGNAAHTLHPVAGQGFNLGLRDVAALAQCIAQKGLNEQMLEHYINLRHGDQKTIIGLTNGLINVFTSRIPGIALARDLGLVLLDNSNFMKKCLSRYAQGYSGVIPDLVCQIALDKKGAYEPPV